MSSTSEAMVSLDGELPSRVEAWEGGWPQGLQGFERLVEEFQRRLVRYAFRRLGNLNDAEDVAQEVFVRAYADRGRRRTVANVSAYLYRMAANLCTDQLRRRKHQNLSLDEVGVMEIPTSHPDGRENAAAAQAIERVEALLRRLRPDEAEVIRLRVLDELGPREIAEVLGLRESTVKARLRHGLEKLRVILGKREVSR